MMLVRNILEKIVNHIPDIILRYKIYVTVTSNQIPTYNRAQISLAQTIWLLECNLVKGPKQENKQQEKFNKEKNMLHTGRRRTSQRFVICGFSERCKLLSSSCTLPFFPDSTSLP